jgi:hypothetical protein
MSRKSHTIQLRDEVCQMQRADEGEVAGFLREQTDLLVFCYNNCQSTSSIHGFINTH